MEVGSLVTSGIDQRHPYVLMVVDSEAKEESLAEEALLSPGLWGEIQGGLGHKDRRVRWGRVCGWCVCHCGLKVMDEC